MSTQAKETKPPVAPPWNLRDLRDTRENVREAVAAAAFVPPAAKAMLDETIAAHFPNARLLRLDAHLHVIEQQGRKTVSVAISIADL